MGSVRSLTGVIAWSGIWVSSLAISQDAVSHVRSEGAERGVVVRSQSLPKLTGDRLTVFLVQVHYGPGEASIPHSHVCPVIGYVVEGALRTRIAGEAEKIYKAGDSFYEAPNRVHLVSANASSTEPAELIAYLICDRDTPLSVPAPAFKKEGGK